MVDWKLVQQGKDSYRDRVRSRSFADKLQTLERLREREAQLKSLRPIRHFVLGTRSSAHFLSHASSNELSHGSDRLFLMGANSTLVAIMTNTQVTGTAAVKTLLEPHEP